MTNVLTSTELAERIEKLICVSKPYYALQDLQQLEDGTMQAEIMVENISHDEATFISAAEAGRHLAILGSCALAAENPIDSKHYYLANQAFIVRGKNDNAITFTDIPLSTTLILQAQVIFLHLEKKSAKVSTSIRTQSGEIIFELEVAYQVLKAGLFEKLFKKGFKQESPEIIENPYTKTVDIKATSYEYGILSGSLGTITAEQCAGHFDNYPALPIAILSGGLVKLAGMHLKIMFKNNNLKYAVKRSTLSATRLAFAGEEVFVHSTFISGTSTGEYTFFAKAMNAQSEDLGEIEITFDLMKEAMNTATEHTHYFPLRNKYSII